MIRRRYPIKFVLRNNIFYTLSKVEDREKIKRNGMPLSKRSKLITLYHVDRLDWVFEMAKTLGSMDIWRVERMTSDMVQPAVDSNESTWIRSLQYHGAVQSRVAIPSKKLSLVSTIKSHERKKAIK